MARTIQLGEYQLRVLNHDEFNKLPYADATESLGMADRNRKMAFIRETGLPALDVSTMEHELQELLSDVSLHEENGIRYKKAKQILGPLSSVLSFVPGPWQPFAMAYSMGSGVYDVSKNGLTWQNAMQLAPSAMGAFKGFTTGGLSGALKGSVGIQAPKAPSLAESVKATTPGGTPLMNSVNTAKSATERASSTFGGAQNVGSGISALSDSAVKAIESAKPTVMQQLGEVGKQMATNLGTQAVAQQILPDGGMPVQQGGGMMDAFLPQVATDRGAYQPAYSDEDVASAVDSYNQNIQQRKQQTFDMFRRANPGTSIEGNTAFARTLAELDTSAKQGHSDLLAGIDRANQQKYKQDTYNQMKSLNSLDDNQMAFLIDLSKKPDSEIQKYVNTDINQFKEVFGSLA